MQKYVIERSIPAVGQLSQADLAAIARRSNEVIEGMNERVHWLESYVTDDRIYCVYLAASAEAVREHARRGGFPADSVSPVRSMLDPTSGR